MTITPRSFLWLFWVAALLLPGVPASAADESVSPLFQRAQQEAERDGYTVLTTDALRELLRTDPTVLVVDARFTYEYEAGHIPGAVNLPVDLNDRADLPPERRKVFQDVFGEEKGRPIVIYCRGFR
jgi:predicted sulfurtransferase